MKHADELSPAAFFFFLIHLDLEYFIFPSLAAVTEACPSGAASERDLPGDESFPAFPLSCVG